MIGSLRLQLEAPEIGLFDDPRNPRFQEPNYHAVYVITANGNPCKIGFSADPDERLAGLQIATPTALNLAFAIWFQTQTWARKIEQASHKKLSDKKIKGEWFAIGVDEAIDAVANCVADAKQPYAAHADMVRFKSQDLQIRRTVAVQRDEKLKNWTKAKPDRTWNDGVFVYYEREGECVIENA